MKYLTMSTSIQAVKGKKKTILFAGFICRTTGMILCTLFRTSNHIYI